MIRHLAALLALLVTSSVGAHAVSTSHVSVLDAQGELQLEVDLAVRDVALEIPLDANGDGEITWGELEAENAALGGLAASAIIVSGDAANCELTPHATGIRRYADGAYVSVALRSECAAANIRTIALGDWLSADPTHRMTLAFDGSAANASVLTADARTFAVADEADGTFASFFREGVRHILEGYDHLAFVISLLLPVVLVGRERRTTRGAFRRAAIVVTAFTIAHSITLSLAALGWVWPAPRFVEVAIAISISLAALNNVFRVVDRRTAWLAGGFGLVHGFGFAGALTELGLPSDARLTGLLAFNLGVEAGQLAVVLVVLPVLSFAAHWRGYRKLVMGPASLAIAALGGVWLVARLA